MEKGFMLLTGGLLIYVGGVSPPFDTLKIRAFRYDMKLKVYQ